MRAALLCLALIGLAACDSADDQANAPANQPPALSPLPQTLTAEQQARLGSTDCAEVVQLYLEAIGGKDWPLAARVWDDPVIDAARLEAVFGAYKEAQVAWTDPFIEGAAGTLHCTVTGKLTDAQDPAKPLQEGTLLLSRVNDVPGASPDQLRWTMRSSTLVDRLERAGTDAGSGG